MYQIYENILNFIVNPTIGNTIGEYKSPQFSDLLPLFSNKMLEACYSSSL